ncbi:MAG: 4-alpha-glucanotransferase [Oscillospiraceae bacterium]|nr:4-alpha-glucanotransferase [Oscillospiraceae bacterium]
MTKQQINHRASGVLMPVSSLPGPYGTGTLGKEACAFIDLLKRGGFSYWQILPLNEPDECHSPYKSASAFACNPLLIDLEDLAARGLLLPEELAAARTEGPYRCAFDFLAETHLPLLRKAFACVDGAMAAEIEQFQKENPWAVEYAAFKELKGVNRDAPWREWAALAPLTGDAAFYVFLQYIFFSQWDALKTYANDAGVKLIGDMPFYVSEDSADVYFHKEIFQLDARGVMTAEAGVPPDYFSADGQNWGSPLYDWDALQASGYAWWIDRIRFSLRMFDKVRVDHFRAFADYWAIPAGGKAVDGAWCKGPGMTFFNALTARVPAPGIIAEDLGDIDAAVVQLLEATGFPGMRVWQFGFSGDKDNPHLPYNYISHTVAYTGTHDNNTLLGWLWELPEDVREQALQYCGFSGNDWGDGGAYAPALRAMLRALYQSVAELIIVPMQDLCGFGADTRMNTPGSVENNWAWRVTEEQLAGIDWDGFRDMGKLYGRG